MLKKFLKLWVFSMNWKDILKNVITQGKIKEIEDIDIDIEDDDCRRWYDKLIKIVNRISIKNKYPDHLLIEGWHREPFPDFDEETACLLKKDLTEQYAISTETIKRENRAKETYRRHGFLVARSGVSEFAYGVKIYTLLERLGEKRDTEYGDVAIDIFIGWGRKGSGLERKVGITGVLTDERIKENRNGIKELLRHLEQTWAIDTLERYGAFK